MRSDPVAAREMLLQRDARDRLNEATVNCVEERSIVVGRLEVLHIDDEQGATTKFFLNDGATQQPVFGLPADVSAGATLKVEGVKIDGELLAATSIPGSSSVKTLAAAQAALNVVNQHRPLLVLMGNYANTGVTFPDIASLNSMTTNLNAYYQENSFGRLQWDVTNRDWVRVAENKPTSGTCDWGAIGRMVDSLIAANDEAVDFTQFEDGDLVVMFPFQDACHYRGFSWGTQQNTLTTNDGAVHMNIAYVRLPYNLPQTDLEYVLNHELGHNFGLDHANWAQCSDGQTFPTDLSPCTTVSYEDLYDVMGGEYRPGAADSGEFRKGHFAAEKKAQLGWIDPDQIVTMSNGSTEQTVDLTPMEWSGPGTKLIRVQRGQNDYLSIEFRQAMMADGVTATSDGTMFLSRFPTVFQGALLRQSSAAMLLDASPTPVNDPADATLAVGQSLTDPASGATISVISQSVGALRVHITPPIVDYWVPPPVLQVFDGLNEDIDETNDTTTVSAHWTPVADLGTGLDRYDVAVTTADTGLVSSTSSGVSTSVTFSNLTIPVGTTYYVTVQAVDRKGNVSYATWSDGVTVSASQPSPTVIGVTGTRPYAPDCVYAGSEFLPDPPNVVSFGNSVSIMAASWCESPDVATVTGYVYGIGTTPGATDVLPYTSAGLSLHVVRSGLVLTPDRPYYVTVRAISNTGTAGAVRNSAAYTVDQTAPPAPAPVNDGIGQDEDITSAVDRWRANWPPVSDASPITYFYALGSTPGAFDVISPTTTPITLLVLDDIPLPAGRYYTSILAKDAAGNISAVTSSDGMTIDPNSDPVSPTVAVTSPAADATISGIVTLTATASDNVAVESVQFAVDGVTVGAAQRFSPYHLTWNTNAVSNGTHTITAVARDASNTATSLPVSATINNVSVLPTDPPFVMFMSPAENSTVSGIITLRAIGVSGRDGTYLVDGTAIQPLTIYQSFLNMSWDTTTVTNGTHLIQVVVYDVYGNEGTQSMYLIVLNVDTSAPQRTSDLQAI